MDAERRHLLTNVVDNQCHHIPCAYQSISNSRQSCDDDDDLEHVLSAVYESLDYDTIENDITCEETSKQVTSWHHTKIGCFRWLIAFMIGLVTGSIAVFIDFSVESVSQWKFSIIKHFVDDCVDDDCMYIPMMVWVIFNVSFVFIATFLVAIIEPCAAGSGIPQIKCYLNGVKVPRVVRLKTLFSKVVGVVGAVVGGLAVGKEGPMIHAGAVVAAGVSQGRSTTLGFDLGIFKYFRSDREKRDFVSGGAAAGVAAAFGAPVGGMLFSLEEGASFWNQGLTWRIFFSAIVSTFTLNVWKSYINNTPWELSNPGLINFGKFNNMSYDIYEICIFAMMGFLGGVLGALFNVMNRKLTLFRNRLLHNKYLQMLEAVTVAMMTAVAGYLVIFFYNNCIPRTFDNNSTSHLHVQLFCRDGYESASTNLFFNTPEVSVTCLFHKPYGAFHPVMLVLYTMLYFFLAIWTYGLAVPSGIFIPSLLIGAGWGRLIGIAIPGDPGKYSLICAAAQLGGIVRMTVSLTVIIMEATGNISLGLGIMVTLICAKWSGDYIGHKLGCAHGIYDMHIHLSGVPFLEWEPSPLLSSLHAKDIMSHPVTVLRIREPVSRIISILKENIHNGYPVVDNYDIADPLPPVPDQTFGRLCGIILRHQLIVLIEQKVWYESPDYMSRLRSFSNADFGVNYPRYSDIQNVSVSPVEATYSISLKPFMNSSPYTVLSTSYYPKIFEQFRGLGMRHLVVTNLDSQVVGMVTRKDLARYRTQYKDGQWRVDELRISVHHKDD